MPSANRLIIGPAGYHSVLFIDDYSQYKPGQQPSESLWTYDTGTGYPGGPANWGTGEVQTYTKSTNNIVITSSGTLMIKPIKTNGKWTSARIETKPSKDFSCPAGKKIRMETTIKVGNAASSTQLGIWPAFWSLGTKYRGNYNNWPGVSELDILEQLNGDATAYQTLHCGTATTKTGGPCNEPNGLGGSTGFTRGQFHTVGLEIDRTNAGGAWQGEKLVWYLDGTVVRTITGSSVNNQAAWNEVARGTKFLLLNVAVGGSFPDAIARTKTPTSATISGTASAIEVQYVAVYST
ncbi:concanavalin A-like lectin/glucanase [Thozetella sp. PMI_491]|nr:concanavalin A-like lectin/glucanase [Thozetella sp. PMI_491]KAH8896985.1 concanavalin A-like lectin/glucanase [Thozetella sp. PMI_491]